MNGWINLFTIYKWTKWEWTNGLIIYELVKMNYKWIVEWMNVLGDLMVDWIIEWMIEWVVIETMNNELLVEEVAR